jgi:sugar phosphate isomerase/epimerase
MKHVTVSRRSFLQTSLAAGGAAAMPGLRCGGPTGDYAGWNLCIATWGLRYSSGPEVAKILKEVGAVYIDLVAPLDSIDSTGKRDNSIKAYHENPATWQPLKDALQDNGIKLFQYDGGLTEDMDDNRKKMEWAKAQGFKCIMCAPPYAALDGISRLVEEYDLYAGIHNHGPTDKLYKTTEQCWNAIKDQHPNLGMCADVGHFWRAGVDPVNALETFGDRVHNIHMKDQMEVGGKEQGIIGEGNMDIPALLRTLKKINYNGPMCIEYEMHPENPVPGLKASLANLREMCQAL